MKTDVYQIVTDRILALLDAGTVPWRKPWNFTGYGDGLSMPRNFVSKKPYQGFNVLMLLCSPYDCPYWLTYKQAVSLGGSVRKGEKSTQVVFWKRLPKTKDGKPVLNAKGKPEQVFFLRYYNVFNLLQCDGITWEKPVAAPKPDGWTPISAAEAIVANMPKRPEIKHGGGRAYYSPSMDYVGMPARESFPRGEEYYSVLFHELTHSTRHASRLNRKEPGEGDNAGRVFGSDPYAREELVAELGAAFLCGHSGIENTLENSAAYIANWRTKLSKDNKLIVMAAAQAQKAADYILGNLEPEPEESEE